MFKSVRTLSLILAAAGASSPAFSADLSAPASYDWTGFHVGVSAGYATGDLDATAVDPTTAVAVALAAGASASDPEGGIFAIQGGYDHQFSNNVVIGGELFIPVATFDEDATTLGATFTGDVNWLVMFNARLGYAFDRFLPYFVLGGFVGEGEVEGPVNTFEETHVGVSVGAGLEYALADSWSVRGEVLYSHAFEESYGDGDEFDIEAEYDNVAITLGVNYRF